MITSIIKRDGSIVFFNKDKITEAIFSALKAVGQKNYELAQILANKVVEILEKRFGENKIPSVEEVQDIVEYVLIKEGQVEVAKAYILYREKRAIVRESKNMLLDVENTINEYIKQTDWRVKENSNQDFSFSGLLLHTAGKVIVNYALNYIYPQPIGDAFKKGYIHLHDLGNGFIGYCCGHSLKNLFLRGFGGVPNKTIARPAKHMDVVVHHIINYTGCLQMEFAGAQAFNSVDSLIAPFVKTDNLTYKEVKQNIQKLVYSLNVPNRWGSQTPFSNLTFDWIVPDDMKNEKAIVGGEEQNFTYGKCQEEMNMINKAFIEVMGEGDASGRIFTFPIPTYNITRDFDWEGGNAYELFDLTAKFGTPYFQNYVGSNLDPKSMRAMCCRLNLNQKELLNRPGGMWNMGDSTGSLGVVTINMPRIAYESKTKEEFFLKLDYYMTLAKDSLEIKRKVVEKNLENGLMPYTKVYLGSFRNHFSTIGISGMHEACLNFMRAGIETKEGKQFAIETLHFMRDRCLKFQKETGNLYNLEATPAESTAYRFAKIDKRVHADIIASGQNEPYYTNSTFLPVNYTDDLITAIEHQNDIQPLYTGGTIFHVFLGEQMQSADSCMQLVRKISYNTRLPYFSITPTFSICPTHKYLRGKHIECPICKKETEVYSRVVGYFRPVKNWNVGKQEEFKQRVTFSERKAIENNFSRKLVEIAELQTKFAK